MLICPAATPDSHSSTGPAPPLLTRLLQELGDAPPQPSPPHAPPMLTPSPKAPPSIHREGPRCLPPHPAPGEHPFFPAPELPAGRVACLRFCSSHLLDLAPDPSIPAGSLSRSTRQIPPLLLSPAQPQGPLSCPPIVVDFLFGVNCMRSKLCRQWRRQQPRSSALWGSELLRIMVFC